MAYSHATRLLCRQKGSNTGGWICYLSTQQRQINTHVLGTNFISPVAVEYYLRNQATTAMEIRPPTKEETEADVSYVAHRLPCTIHVDGPLPTARAFCPFPEPMTSFRGRKLESATFEIPPSSQLVVVEKNPHDNDVFQIKRVLDRSLVHYQHDDCPVDNSPVPLALRWLTISDALHEPISTTEIKPATNAAGENIEKAQLTC